MAPSNDPVMLVQQALTRQGFDVGRADGDASPRTVHAVRNPDPITTSAALNRSPRRKGPGSTAMPITARAVSRFPRPAEIVGMGSRWNT